MATAILFETEKMVKRPETEIERQQRVVSSLGDDFAFPLFNGRQAVESQRKSGYKNTARASREIIDNSYESGAKKVWVVLKRPDEKSRARHERKDAVASIAFIDDGPGMIPEMARYALSWGGGTHFENPTGIGRFGFGLPNASINQTRRVEVYTRTSKKDAWVVAVLDITKEKLADIPPSGLIQVDEPVEAELPDFVKDFLKSKKVSLDTGTVVVWDKPDRLTARSAATLKKLMLDDFGVVYRNLLENFTIDVDGTVVQKVDPLFLTPGALYYKPQSDGGAECTYERTLSVKYHRDPETGTQHLELLETAAELKEARQDPNVEAIGTIDVRIARFPYGFAAEKIDVGGTEKRVPKENDEYKRLQIRKKRRGISFVRAGREIDTVDNLPTTHGDKADGLGDWPTLQGYALHWGIEASFSPTLDEAFGIGNDKQTVNPIEDFWRVLVKAEVDKAARHEQKHQQIVRKKKRGDDAQKQASDPDAVNPAVEAAVEAEAAMGRGTPLPEERVKESKERFEEKVKERTEQFEETPDEAEEALKTEARRKKFAVDFFEADGGVFFRPDYGNGMQVVAQINTAHPFFKFFYSEVANMPNPRPRQAVELLLFALAKSELESDNKAKLMLSHKREAEWSPFLKLGYSILDDLVAENLEENEEEVEADGDA